MVTLFNGDGFDYEGEIIASKKNQIMVAVNSKARIENESSLNIQLLQPLSRGDKMDWCIQKATELGVSRITPVISERVNINIPQNRLDKKMIHWSAVITSACEQSGRAQLPQLDSPQTFQTAIETIADEATKIVAAPGSCQKISTYITEHTDCCVCLVGPEGGLVTKELELAENNGFTAISLGARILRLETAVIATIALVQAQWGDMR